MTGRKPHQYYACIINLGGGQYRVIDGDAENWNACRRAARQIGLEMSPSIPLTWRQAGQLRRWF